MPEGKWASWRLNLNPFKKGRKYPIRRDEAGRTARQRAFALLDLDYTIDQVAVEVGISRETARRYHYDWGKRGKGWEIRYNTIKHLWKTDPEFSERLVDDLAKALGMTKAEVIGRLQQPSGLKRALLGQWPNRHLEGVRRGVETRLSADNRSLFPSLTPQMSRMYHWQQGNVCRDVSWRVDMGNPGIDTQVR